MGDEWIKSDLDKLRSLIADEAKTLPILDNIAASVKQLKAKSTFRLALLNQLLEKELEKDNKYY